MRVVTNLEGKVKSSMLELNPLAGNKPIKDNESKIGSVSDFWGWAFSALYVPIPRGFFAEYIVYKSINCGDDSFRPPLNYLSTKLEKDEPDLITYLDDDKMTIQVKSIDSIKQKQAFEVRKLHGYNPNTDKNDGDLAHNSDLFVLCFLRLDKESHDKVDSYRKNGCREPYEILHCRDLQESLNNAVLNMINWNFYVLPSITAQKKNFIHIFDLEDIVTNGHATKCNYSDLHSTIKHYHKLKVA